MHVKLAIVQTLALGLLSLASFILGITAILYPKITKNLFNKLYAKFENTIGEILLSVFWPFHEFENEKWYLWLIRVDGVVLILISILVLFKVKELLFG